MAIKLSYDRTKKHSERVILTMGFGDFLGLHGSANKLKSILGHLDHTLSNPDGDDYVHWVVRGARQMDELLVELHTFTE